MLRERAPHRVLVERGCDRGSVEPELHDLPVAFVPTGPIVVHPEQPVLHEHGWRLLRPIDSDAGVGDWLATIAGEPLVVATGT
jgi:hypothetical protein